MKIAILSLFMLATAAAADIENVVEDQDSLIQDLLGEDSAVELDEASTRRRRRGCCRHRHKPHRHNPHFHNPHGHRPHGHNPHFHGPHGHRPHFHGPHGHTDCFEAQSIKNKILYHKDKVEFHDKNQKDWQNEYNRLDAEMKEKMGNSPSAGSLMEISEEDEERDAVALVEEQEELDADSSSPRRRSLIELSRRRRRRKIISHSHSPGQPHSHSPPAHDPHSHTPHSHGPHTHTPHSHKPHSHDPHHHTPFPTSFPTPFPTPNPTAFPTPFPTTPYPTAFPTDLYEPLDIDYSQKFTTDNKLSDAEALDYQNQMNECKIRIEHYGHECDKHNAKAKNEKEKYKKNDCKEINNACNKALEAIQSIVDAIVAFLEAFACMILDEIFAAMGKVLDGMLMLVPGLNSIITILKAKPWCVIDMEGKPKKGDTGNIKPTGAEKKDTFTSIMVDLVTPPPSGKISPLAVIKKLWNLWCLVVKVIDNDDLTAKAGPDSPIGSIMWWLIQVWTAVCGAFMTVIMNIAKNILYCNVPSLGCRCEQPGVFKF